MECLPPKTVMAATRTKDSHGTVHATTNEANPAVRARRLRGAMPTACRRRSSGWLSASSSTSPI